VTVQVDARTLNWRFVVPDEPEGLLCLPVNGERRPLAVAEEGLNDLGPLQRWLSQLLMAG
jgi:hypothetical protein